MVAGKCVHDVYGVSMHIIKWEVNIVRETWTSQKKRKTKNSCQQNDNANVIHHRM